MATRGLGAGEWQAIHIFYAADPRPLLARCVGPLVDGLLVEGLVTSWFFVNYWLEGPHLRLRLKSRSSEDAAAVRGRAETAVGAFLEGRPALYEVKPELVDFYTTVFLLEYAPQDRERLLGPDGSMRLRPTNTYSFEPYVPDRGRYGGPAGTALAEWHFRHSSELAVALAREPSPRRSTLLGVAGQLMTVMLTAFLHEERLIADFLARYHESWLRLFALADAAPPVGREHGQDAAGAEVARGVAGVRRALHGRGGLSEPLRRWAEHCAELRERTTELARAGKLAVPPWHPGPEPVDPATAVEPFLGWYLRLTNNRLQVSMRDEPYLAGLLERSMRDSSALEAWA
ncbi:hypothetical protein GCM10027168_28100 [Streptomyces capparidis]